MKPINSFHISCPGDGDAGIPTASAEVQFPIDGNWVEAAPDDFAEYVEFVREQLREAFVAIWDDTRVTVMTDVECADMAAAEAAELG